MQVILQGGSMKRYLYESFETDFFDDGKPHELPEDYEYIRDDFLSKCRAALTYSLAVAFGTIYCRLFLHMKIKGAYKLRKHKGGFILYGNHTQPVGDVVIPAVCCFPKRIYTVVSPANFDIPVIGRVLRPLGALPLASTLGGMREFGRALEKRVKKHPIIIYPEAHVWPYYTKIRPFGEGAFKYPDKLGAAAYSMTTTYQKRKLGKKPKMTVYIDGPFYGEGKNAKERAICLCDAIYAEMTEKSKNSNYCYIEYCKTKKTDF